MTRIAVNCAGAVNAVTLQPAEVAHDDEAADLVRALIRECIAVGRAKGATLPDDLPDSIVDGYRSGPADSINADRPTESDARNGVTARLLLSFSTKAGTSEQDIGSERLRISPQCAYP